MGGERVCGLVRFWIYVFARLAFGSGDVGFPSPVCAPIWAI